MTGFGNSTTTVTVPVEALTILCRPTFRRSAGVWCCMHCEGHPMSDEADFAHEPTCPAAEVWAWALATGGPAKRPTPAAMARIEKALEGIKPKSGFDLDDWPNLFEAQS